MMKRIILFTIPVIVVCLILTGCGTSEKAIQTAIAETEQAAPAETDIPEPSITNTAKPRPTETATSTNIPEPTGTPEPSIITDAFGISMVLIPAGEFEMGMGMSPALSICRKYSERFDDNECVQSQYDNMGPSHIVSLDAYFIDQYEVTNAAYRECVKDGVCDSPEGEQYFSKLSYNSDEYYGNSKYDEHPVIYIDWEDANTYCEWRQGRLPTEAEWEKAARGMDGRAYPWGNEFDNLNVNFCDVNCLYERWADKEHSDGYQDIAPVGSYPGGASPYGVYDMAGNVSEWINDWYGDDYYSSSSAENPPGPSSGEYRVYRGGNWSSSADFVLTTSRSGLTPDVASTFTGFRCVVDVELGTMDNNMQITETPANIDLLSYTLYQDNSTADKESFKVNWDILINSQDITEESLTDLMEYLFQQAFEFLPGPTDSRTQLVFMYLYTSKEHADSGMGQWIGMVSKYADSSTPHYSIDELVLKSVNATPENKLGLSELERKEIWNELIHIEDRSFAEAERRYPDDYFDYAMELQDNYLLELAQSTGLTLAELDEIGLEGAVNNWPFPTQKDW